MGTDKNIKLHIVTDIKLENLFVNLAETRFKNGTKKRTSTKGRTSHLIRTTGGRRRKRFRSSAHFCVLQRYICSYNRFIRERNHLEDNWRYESQGGPGRVFSVRSYVGSAGCRGTVQGNWNHCTPRQASSNRR